MAYQHARSHPYGELQKSEIKVTGEGSIFVQPNRAKIVLGVETDGLQLEEAQEENSKKISQIIRGLTTMGILEENIQTTNFSIFPMYDFVDGRQIFRGYRIEHLLQITVQNTDQVGLVVDTAVQNGANRVSNISFHLSNPREAYHQALKMAVEDAIQKANTIAATLHVHLIQIPFKVMEEPLRAEGPIPFMESQMVKAAATTEIEPGKQEIRAIVTAIFSSWANA